MIEELLNDKMENIIKLSDNINEIINSDRVSKISETNKPFILDIFPEEIGLTDFKVNSPIFTYNEKNHTCYLHKINLSRIFNLNQNFNSLNQNEKNIILYELIPILKKQFTHIYKIIEKRNTFIISDYVENKIDYICYGCKINY